MVTDKAFRRRPGKDLDGLSVARVHAAAKRFQQSGAGVAVLRVSEIQRIGLSVCCPGDHGTIDGLPFDTPDNYAVVIELAVRLCAIAEFKEDRW